MKIKIFSYVCCICVEFGWEVLKLVVKRFYKLDFSCSFSY